MSMEPGTSDQELWDQSYQRHENYVFVPSDETVRFFARFLRKRVGLAETIDIAPNIGTAKILDAGCGVGRNVMYGSQLGLNMYGFDHSHSAICLAREWLLSTADRPDIQERCLQADIQSIPWPNEYFDHVLSDSVLDSMAFQTAKAGVKELARVIKPGGYFWFSVISSRGSRDSDLTPGEVVIRDTFEFGTTQSYFDYKKIRRMVAKHFTILHCELHEASDPEGEIVGGRWYATCRRNAVPWPTP